MKFKVTLQRPSRRPDESPFFNPFTRPLSVTATIPMLLRMWEIDAENEAEIRRLLDEAYRDDLPNVRGYTLRSIEEIKPAAAEGG